MRLDWKQTFGFAFSVLMVFANFADAQDDKGTKDDRPAIVLKNATIHTMGASGTFVGDVLVSGGEITAIGKNITTPKNADVYQLKGYHVVPGLIESRGKLWLTTAGVAESNTKAELNVVDAIDPWSEDWRELASQGITSVYVQPNSRGSLGGYGAVLRVGPFDAADGNVDDIILKKDAAIQAAIGITGATSRARLTQFLALEKLLESAKEKKKETKKDDSKTKAKPATEKTKDAVVEPDKRGTRRRGGRGTRRNTEQKKDDDKSKADEKTEKKKKEKKETDPTKLALRRVLKREIPLHIELHHSDSLKRVLGLAKKFKIRVVLDGLTQSGRYADDLDDSNVPIVVGPFVEQNATPAYRKNGDLSWLSDDLDADRLWSLSGFSTTARGSRLLRAQAAAAVRSGIDSDIVLAAVTSNPARMLGVGDRVGTIEVGKQADLAVFSGDPLDPSTPARLVMSNGEITFESDASAIESMTTGTTALPERLPATYAIKTTRMLQGGKFVESTMVIVDGKIKSIGDGADVGDVTVFDLGDTVVSPGLVVASSSLGQAAQINDATDSDASHLRSVDAVDPTTKQAKEMLAGGFIHIGLSPGVTNTSAGLMGHVRLGSGNYVANPAIASQFVFGKSARNANRFPASLNGQIQLIDGLFDGQSPPNSLYVTSAIRRSIQQEKLENVKSVADGKRHVVMAANSNLEIRSAIRLAKKQKLSPALLSSGRVGDLAKKLADQKFGLIVVPFADSAYDAQLQQVVMAGDAGLELAFAGETAEKIRTAASMLAAAGVPAESILKGLTESGGAMVGMEQTGLKKGAIADFVVWTGSPLDLASKPLNVVVDGQIVTQK